MMLIKLMLQTEDVTEEEVCFEAVDLEQIVNANSKIKTSLDHADEINVN
jgi:hypothetical protein